MAQDRRGRLPCPLVDRSHECEILMQQVGPFHRAMRLALGEVHRRDGGGGDDYSLRVQHPRGDIVLIGMIWARRFVEAAETTVCGTDCAGLQRAEKRYTIPEQRIQQGGAIPNSLQRQIAH
ncbi:hypothetical protein WR25_21012 [Diploscapter pachys]|uniref:Uncharacterized protein n=1 Tax=Diploscapter pachys TaxID=2018661 RepID=A0A2A2KG38_9BILA|nr:hypothetical protein WR25_21012 [Diploscapter pachys]